MNIRRYILSLLLLCSCLAAVAAPDVCSVVRQDGTVVESTDYYPYSTPVTTANSVQPYKYGTKELDRMHALDLYDSEARWYDSLLGHTSTMDPLAEKYYSLSPYTWCAGNPVKYVDPDGLFVVSEEFERRFPRTTNYLKHGIKHVLDNKKIKNALIKYSKRSIKLLENDFTFGKGPALSIIVQSSYGCTYSFKRKAYMYISKDLLSNLEQAEGKKRDELLFLVAVTILHEYTHYGDAVECGNTQGIEEGEAFEIEAYGKEVTGSSSAELIEKWLKAKNDKSNKNNENNESDENEEND